MVPLNWEILEVIILSKNSFFNQLINYHKQGIPKGVYSICTANEIVIEAAMEMEIENNNYILIESTCNQVNQFGGYSGMTPFGFRDFVFKIAEKIGFPSDKIILGGDHLGPNPWKENNASVAMEKACQLINNYIEAGYTKIHIDTSMRLADDNSDKNNLLVPEVIASRGARLATVAESAFRRLKQKDSSVEPPVYVIGTEVPVPGGIVSVEEKTEITKVEDLKKTISLFKKQFFDNKLGYSWNRVIAVVVQPGVEFSAYSIDNYERSNSIELSNYIKKMPGIVFEVHSTDYQEPESLKQLVEDGFTILKVGPALTFAMREAFFSLNMIEEELLKNKDVRLSELINTIDRAMLNNPSNWNEYYKGDVREIELARKYSFSDRLRYYWAVPEVRNSIQILFNNLRRTEIPLTLLSQYMPEQYKKVKVGLLNKDPRVLIRDQIISVLENYKKAVN